MECGNADISIVPKIKRRPVKLMKIDAHYHLANTETAVDDLLRDMDKAGLDLTLLMGGPENGFWEFKKCGFAKNEAVLQAVKDHPDRLIGNVYLDPRESTAVDTFKRYMDAGFKCVKMFPPVGFYPDEERFFPLYEKIEQENVPILFHAGQTNIKLISNDPQKREATNSKYGNPMNFDMISRLFPGIPIILAHMGYPYYTEAWSVAHANQNVYLDIAGSGPWIEGIPLVYNALGGQNYIPIDFKRVIWGSDNCMPQGESMARGEVYLRQIGCTSQERGFVFGETALKLLKLNSK